MTSPADRDRIIRTIASRQHGLVTRHQLRDAGLSRRAIDYRIGSQRLEVVHRGVYRVGPIRSLYESEMAAVLACGATAVVSHDSAAALWEVLPRARTVTIVHVSIPRGSLVVADGVRVHRSALRVQDTTRVHDIPVTTVARTLLDLAARMSEHELERAVAMAERRQLADAEQIKHVLELYPRHRGVRKLRALVCGPHRAALTRSEAEDRFLALIRRAELRAPAVSATVRGFEVDFLWRTERLVVEIDGFAYHSSAAAFERDRRRDAVLTAAGLRVMRVTWTQLVQKPETVLTQIAQALARAGRA